MAMRLTFHNERSKDIKGKHNDRNFDIKRAGHIIDEEVKNDIFYNYQDGFYDGDSLKEHKTFREIELEYYKSEFGDSIARSNEKYEANYQYKQVKSISDVYESSRTKPEDIILQIGDIKQSATKEELYECLKQYLDWFNENYSSNCKILSMALHVDEPGHSPHVHIRRVWQYEDEIGITHIGQGKALEQLNVELPNPYAIEDKFNNRKTTVSKTERDKLLDICEELGLDMVKAPREKKQKRIEQKDYNRAFENGKEFAIEQSNEWIWANMLFENGYKKDEMEAYKRKHEERLRQEYILMAKSKEYDLSKLQEVYPEDTSKKEKDKRASNNGTI